MLTKRKIPLLKNRSSQDHWFELVENKPAFYQILNVLARYYKQFELETQPTESQKFRDDLIETSPADCRVFFKKFTEFEYLIYAEIHEKNNIRSDYWIHVDGIAEERNEQKCRNNPEHPVFSIVCVSDLFEKNCRKAAADLEEYLQK